MRNATTGLSSLALLIFCACAHQPPPPALPPAQAPAPPAPAAPLFDNLGDHHRAITTKSAEAQRYFDQGLRLIYAFNHDEAQRSFEEAARRDPSCAMCYWGAALTLGPNYNLPAMPDRIKAAHAASAKAQERAAAGPLLPIEKALIGALAHRYADPPPADAKAQAALDAAYADAMRQVARTFPEDLDVATLFAEALMRSS